MLLDILRIIAGLALGLFIPGYVAARLFFEELSELEKIALGFVLSIALDICIGLVLGYNATMKNLTGGITAFNLWIYLGVITIILIIMWRIRHWHEHIAFIDWMKNAFKKK
jgi:uncharacterized membrane protein